MKKDGSSYPHSGGGRLATANLLAKNVIISIVSNSFSPNKAFGFYQLPSNPLTFAQLFEQIHITYQGFTHGSSCLFHLETSRKYHLEDYSQDAVTPGKYILLYHSPHPGECDLTQPCFARASDLMPNVQLKVSEGGGKAFSSTGRGQRGLSIYQGED